MTTTSPFAVQNTPAPQDNTPDSTQTKKKKAPNLHKEVIAIIQNLEYYRDPLGKYYAKLENNEISEIVNIDYDKFTSALSRIIFDKYEIPFDQKGVRFCIGISRPDIELKAKDANFINRIGTTDTALYINRGRKHPSFIKVDYESGKYEYSST